MCTSCPRKLLEQNGKRGIFEQIWRKRVEFLPLTDGFAAGNRRR